MWFSWLVKHRSNDKRSTDEGSNSRVKEVGERRGGRVLKSPLFEFERVRNGAEVDCNVVRLVCCREDGEGDGEKKER